MKKMIGCLFDLQRFSENKRLARMIAEAEGCLVHELDDEEMSLVAAAGEAEPPGIEDLEKQRIIGKGNASFR